MLHNATRRTLCLTAGLVWIATAAAGEPWNSAARSLRLQALIEQSAAELLATSLPSFQERRGPRKSTGLQLDPKAGLGYRTRLALGDASWVLRLKGPLLKRKRLGLGVEVTF